MEGKRLEPLHVGGHDWKALSALLDEALEMPGPERRAWFERLTHERPALKPALERLLSAHARIETSNFLGRPVRLRDALPAAPSGHSAPALAPGMEVGRYRLIRELGQGGMGVVWLAERTDGLLKRPVALKLPLFSAHNRALAERFERERDILGGLSHQRIAQLHDAGFTHSGQPFLALEYVEGVPVTDYCNQHALPINARIELFLQVLDAVQHAHASLVLHRDLKPSNILVSESGEVKLLDFGVAKLLGDAEGEVGQLTQAGGRALTPEYASPEQVAGTPVSTAADVYALGVILCELLSGERPYPSAHHRSRHEIEHAVLHGKPQQPSSLARQLQSTTCGTTPQRLARTLTGDLDSIIIKALDRKPAARYVTAAAFADDLNHYLQGQPVRARGENRWYRTRKFVTRHVFGLAAALLLMLAIGTGGAVAWWQADNARRSNAFLQEMLTPTSYYQDGGRLLTHKEMLERGAARVGERFAGRPRLAAEMYETIAQSLFNLGEHESALAVRTAAKPVFESAYGRHSPEAVRNAARAAYMHLTQRRFTEYQTALNELRQACPESQRPEREHCLRVEQLELQYRAEVGEARLALARWDALKLAELQPDPADPHWTLRIHYWGANAARLAGDIARSKVYWQGIVNLPPDQQSLVGNHMYAILAARTLNDAGFSPQAALLANRIYRQGAEWMHDAFDPKLFYISVLGDTEAASGIDYGAEKILREGIRASESRLGAMNQETADARESLGLLLLARRQPDEARRWLAEALTLERARPARYNESVARIQLYLAVADALQGRRVEALALVRQTLESAEGAGDLAAVPRALVLLSALTTDTAEAESAWQRGASESRRTGQTMPDLRVPLQVLAPDRTLPNAIDDDVTSAIRRYAEQVLAATERELGRR